MSTALVSAFYDVGDVLCQNRKNIVSLGKMSVGMDRKIVGTQAGCQVNTFPRARGFSTSAIQTSPSSSGTISPASSLSSTGSVGSFTFPLALNINESSHFLVNRDLGLSKKVDRSLSVNDASDILRNRDAGNQRNNGNINSSRYKTEMCRPFEENGHCKYGDKCQFAHGIHELRNLARHPKYKTELCRTYHTVGFCPYGPRCHFIHNEDERKLNQINDMKHPGMPDMQSLADISHMNTCYVPQTSMPQPVQSQRPRAISYNPLSLSLGSTGDSPQSSLSGSPTTSPMFFEEMQRQNLENAKFVSASLPRPMPAANTNPNMFNFSNLSNELNTVFAAPLDVQTQFCAGSNSGLYILNKRNNSDTVYIERDEVFSNPPPSSPDSLSGDSVSSLPSSSCGSPRNLAPRLPIFRHISVDDQ